MSTGGASAGPLLALLHRLVCLALAAQPAGRQLRVERAEPQPDGLLLQVRVNAMGGLLDTALPLHVAVVETGAGRTRCRVTVAAAGGLGRLLGGGLPLQLLRQAAARALGDAASLDGELLTIDHAALLRHLRGRLARQRD